VGGELAGLLTTTGALMSDKLMFLNPQPGLRQVNYLSAGHELTFSPQGKTTLTTMGRLVAMNEVGLVDHLERLTGMARLAARFFADFFGQGRLDKGLLLIAVGGWWFVRVSRILSQSGTQRCIFGFQLVDTRIQALNLSQ
jgi:hypothetical protein